MVPRHDGVEDGLIDSCSQDSSHRGAEWSQLAYRREPGEREKIEHRTPRSFSDYKGSGTETVELQPHSGSARERLASIGEAACSLSGKIRIMKAKCRPALLLNKNFFFFINHLVQVFNCTKKEINFLISCLSTFPEWMFPFVPAVWTVVKHDYQPFTVAFEQKKNHQFEKQLHSQKNSLSLLYLFFPQKPFSFTCLDLLTCFTFLLVS